MKETEENITILKKMGFKKDKQGYYNLKSGWGFHPSFFKNFEGLVKRMLKVEESLMNGETGFSIDDLPNIKKMIK